MSYWRGYSKSISHPVNGTIDEDRRVAPINISAFENEPNDKELGVQLNNVSKVINKTKNKHLSFTFSLFIDLFILV